MPGVEGLTQKPTTPVHHRHHLASLQLGGCLNVGLVDPGMTAFPALHSSSRELNLRFWGEEGTGFEMLQKDTTRSTAISPFSSLTVQAAIAGSCSKKRIQSSSTACARIILFSSISVSG